MPLENLAFLEFEGRKSRITTKTPCADEASEPALDGCAVYHGAMRLATEKQVRFRFQKTRAGDYERQ
jgi:hypothetical protein